MPSHVLPVKPPAHQKLKKTNQLKFLKKLLEEKIIKKDIAAEFFSLMPKKNVQNPMDFKTVQLRLKNHFYGRGRECIKDIHLVFSNASKDIENSKRTTDNAKTLENIFYAELDALPKPEIDLPYISDRGSKSTKKEKKSSASQNMNGSKPGNSNISKLRKILQARNSEKKTKTAGINKNKTKKNVEVQKFQGFVDKILGDLTKITLPLDYVDHLKLYDSLSKVKTIQENFKQYSAVKQKEEAPKVVHAQKPKASTSKKIISNRTVEPSSSRVEIPLSKQKDIPVKQRSSLIVPNVKRSQVQNKPRDLKEEKYALPSTSQVEILPSKPKVVPVKQRSSLIVPNVIRSHIQNNPVDLNTLLSSKRFRPAKRPVVTAEREKQRDIDQEKRKCLGDEFNFYYAADIMRQFERENGFYPYGKRGWYSLARNTSAVTTT